MSIKERSILIIDDDEDLRILAKRILKGAGCYVQEAESLQAAREQLRWHPPHLILLDLKLSNEHGFELLKERKADSNYAKIPVIVLSANREKGTVKEAITLGADHYLVKPFSNYELLRKIRKVLRYRQQASLNLNSDPNYRVTAQVRAETKRLNGEKVCIESAARFTGGMPIYCHIEALKAKSIQEVVAQGASLPKTVGDGRYKQILRFIGVTENTEQKIQALLREMLQ